MFSFVTWRLSSSVLCPESEVTSVTFSDSLFAPLFFVLFLVFIYVFVAALGLSFGTRALHCGVRAQ